jgi:hypothetical protein
MVAKLTNADFPGLRTTPKCKEPEGIDNDILHRFSVCGAHSNLHAYHARFPQLNSPNASSPAGGCFASASGRLKDVKTLREAHFLCVGLFGQFVWKR